jgi:hypothetical protein
MRVLAPPPPTSRCRLCGGELRLKQVLHSEIVPNAQTQTFVCVQCGAGSACTRELDPYAGRTGLEPRWGDLGV